MTTEIWVNVYTAFRALKAFQWYHGVRNLSRQLGTYAIDTRDNVAYFSTRGGSMHLPAKRVANQQFFHTRTSMFSAKRIASAYS